MISQAHTFIKSSNHGLFLKILNLLILSNFRLKGSFKKLRVSNISIKASQESTYQCRRYKKLDLDPWVENVPWSGKWQPSPVFLAGKFHGVAKSQT